MRKETAEAIVRAGEDLGYDLTVRENYSGRGMYGETTCGVEYDRLAHLLAAVGSACHDLGVQGREDEAIAVMDCLRHAATDNMGTGWILY